MNKFTIALAAAVSIGLAIPAFAQEKNDMMPPGKMHSEKMHAGKMGMQHTMVVHHHHHYHHMMSQPVPNHHMMSHQASKAPQ